MGFITSTHACLPEVALLGDPGRIRRIVYNLVGNNIKFTDRGDVLLTVGQELLTADAISLQRHWYWNLA
jgi:signal transduction histidine kinase